MPENPSRSKSAQTKLAACPAGPRVVCITRGPLQRDTLSQRYYQAVAEKQAMVHEGQVSLCRDILAIQQRLKAGAIEEEGDWTFDQKTEMVLPREYVESGGRG